MKTTEKRMGQILSILYFLKKISFNAEKAKPNSLAISFFFLKKFKFWRKIIQYFVVWFWIMVLRCYSWSTENRDLTKNLYVQT